MIDGVMVFFLSLMWIESLMHFEWKISLHNIVIVLYLLFLYVKKRKLKEIKTVCILTLKCFQNKFFFAFMDKDSKYTQCTKKDGN